MPELVKPAEMRWSGHCCYCFGTKRPWVQIPPPRPAQASFLAIFPAASGSNSEARRGISRFLVAVIVYCKGAQDAIFTVAAAGIEVQRGRRPLVAHHALHHIHLHRHAVIDQPRGVGVPKIMKPESRIQPGAEGCGFPDAGSEQCPAQRHADGVGVGELLNTG
jgi:hypothetical protein